MTSDPQSAALNASDDARQIASVASIHERIATAWQGYYNHVNGVVNPPSPADEEWARDVLAVLARAGLTVTEAESTSVARPVPYDWDEDEQVFVCQMHGWPECRQSPECIENRPTVDPVTGAQWNGVEER